MKLVIKFPRKLQAPAQTPTSEPHAAAEEAFAEDVDAAKVTSERKGQHKRASTSGQSEDDEGGKSTISTTSIRFKDKTTKASVKETPTINLSISLKGKKQQKQPRKRKLKDFNDVSEGDASAGGANVVINAGKRLKEGTKAPTAITTTTKIRFQFPASREKEKEDRTGSSEKKKSKKDKKEKKKGKKSSLKELIRNRELIKGVISEIEKLDYNEIFKYPVTEEIAPGYFSIVKEPMNTTKMTQKLENNLYTAWQVFWEDCVLMFRNAMQYNPDDSIYYMEAEKMLKDTAKLVSEASGGEVNVSVCVYVRVKLFATCYHFFSSFLVIVFFFGLVQVNESLLQSSGKRTTSGNGLHRKSQSNISGSIFSGGDQDQGKGLMGATSAVSSELLSIPVQQSRDSKNSVKHAIFRRHSFKLPQQSRIMGSLSNLSNGKR